MYVAPAINYLSTSVTEQQLNEKNKKNAEATRVDIIKAALPLFASSGPVATNLNAVAAAGVTRGAIYWHFKNKWDLLDAILTYFTVPVNTFGLEIEAAEQADPLGDIQKMIVNLLRNTATAVSRSRMQLKRASFRQTLIPRRALQ